jgi:hypothetical protein
MLIIVATATLNRRVTTFYYNPKTEGWYTQPAPIRCYPDDLPSANRSAKKYPYIKKSSIELRDFSKPTNEGSLV